MIYIKRILWLLGYPIMYLLSCALCVISLVPIGLICMFLYIKNGDIEGCSDYICWCIALIEWYCDIEPKED